MVSDESPTRKQVLNNVLIKQIACPPTLPSQRPGNHADRREDLPFLVPEALLPVGGQSQLWAAHSCPVWVTYLLCLSFSFVRSGWAARRLIQEYPRMVHSVL